MNYFAPMGLVPVKNDQGAVSHPTCYDIPAGATYGITGNLYYNMPVKLDANDVPTAVTSATDTIIGSFQAIEYVDTNGNVVVANKYTGTALSSTYMIDSQTGLKARLYVFDTVDAFYNITVGNSTTPATFTTAQNGKQFNVDPTTVATGNAITGQSGATLSPTPVAVGQAGQFVCRGLFQASAINQWNNAYPVIMVQINKSYVSAPVTSQLASALSAESPLGEEVVAEEVAAEASTATAKKGAK